MLVTERTCFCNIYPLPLHRHQQEGEQFLRYDLKMADNKGIYNTEE